METLDQAEQWRQFKETYAQMTEDELCIVAEDFRDLVPIAQDALQSVVSERGLKIPLAPAPAPSPEHSDDQEDADDTEDPDRRLVCIRQVRSESEARQLKALLDANFIASCLGPENIVDLEDFKASFDGGVELKVFAIDTRRAADVLARYAPEKEEEDPDEDAEYAVLCPKCHSQEITLRDEAATSADAKYNWTCDACGHEWTDEGIAQKL